jgi:hypothetical protein
MSGTRNADLEIAIKAKADKAIAEFDRFNKTVDENKKAINGIGKAAGVAFAAVTAGIAFSLKEAIKAEEVDRRLETQMKKIGYTSKELSDNLKKTATEIAGLSNYTDDDLKVSMIKLLAVTKDYNAALKFTQTAADLAARRDITLEQATQALTMAYTGNVGRLKMMGIVLPEGVKGLEALEYIMKEVAGGAEENLKPIQQLMKQVGELGEAIGGPFVKDAYKFAEAATKAVNAIIKWDSETGGGLAIAAKYTLALTGLIGAAALLAPKLKEAAAMAKVFQIAMAAHPVLAVAAAVALLSNALLDLGTKYVENYSKEKDFTSSNEGIITKFQARVDMYKRQGDALVQVGEKWVKASEAVGIYEKAIEGLQGKQKSKTPQKQTGTGGDSLGPVLEADLKSNMEAIGIATDNFTADQIAKYNDLYTSQDEMDQVITEKKIARLQEANDKQIEMAAMTSDEIRKYEEAQGSQRLASASQMFGNLSSLMGAKTEEQFNIGKAASVAQALIDTYTGAQAAFTSMAGIPVVGPALGIAAAAAAVVAGQMRIEQINATQFNPEGAAQGVFDFRAAGNGEQMVTTIGQGESIVPRKFTEAMRTGEASLGGGDLYLTVHVNGNQYGITSREIIDQLTKDIRSGIQSGTIPVGRLSGATSS